MVISSCQRPADIRADLKPTTTIATTIGTTTIVATTAAAAAATSCAIRAKLLNKLEEAGKLMLPKRSGKSCKHGKDTLYSLLRDVR